MRSCVVPYNTRTLLSDRSTAALHACCPGEGGIINSRPRGHGSWGLPAVSPNRGVCIWNPIEYMGLIHRNPLDLAVLGQHCRPRGPVQILIPGLVLGLDLHASKCLEQVFLETSANDGRLVSHQQPGVDTSQKADKVDAVVISRPLSRGWQ